MLKSIRAVILVIIVSLTLLGGAATANAETLFPAASASISASADPVDPGFPPTD